MRLSLKLIWTPLLLLLICLSSCNPKADFVISFGSCNNQLMPNKLWTPILENHPDIFIWGGDIIYSDTENMKLMRENYNMMKQNADYKNFTLQVPIIGTWDDHDYGLNDGGADYLKKDSVQQIFLDFFDVSNDDQRRTQRGIYNAKEFQVGRSSINIILLDTRYFRSKLTQDSTGIKRYVPNQNEDSTMLGNEQWKWLEDVFKNSKAQFNIVVSSIQFLSTEHGYETWGNMPLEIERMKNLILKYKPQGVIFLSGDRHLAEFSSLKLDGLEYPLIDFTSSGMTHSWSSFTEESNVNRMSDVVTEKNFGILSFDFQKNTVNMEIRGEENKLLQSISQKY